MPPTPVRIAPLTAVYGDMPPLLVRRTPYPPAPDYPIPTTGWLAAILSSPTVIPVVNGLPGTGILTIRTRATGTLTIRPK